MKKRVGIPIRLTAIVPIIVDMPDDAETTVVDRVDRWAIVDGVTHQETILAALKIAAEDQLYIETLELLNLVAHEIVIKGQVDCYLTSCDGIAPEQKING